MNMHGHVTLYVQTGGIKVYLLLHLNLHMHTYPNAHTHTQSESHALAAQMKLLADTPDKVSPLLPLLLLMDETSLAPGHLVNQFSSGAWEPVVGSRRKRLYK